ncbi:ATP synthase subunit C lysine N-methyltransferase isoform X2 [Mus pahari]|nr:ATP synthase subunit C lysine N-methyltransferase isoform X2 [Mus pahari]XP_029400012.1 ATP synthase subunit C lysine N-methyltransferase isoform X2 [Mus pahari]XP_029400013.1 ATP synthase subunit C lysine N-methyltransferase isoform X2 [Mus pahari]XP_029400014.1 ATP synthase subunit C lysine N-methyltransferase isoform X2 [Mus pahari]XP_029400015.1 ATP synthase subunit C lysine N-methyltransferase isoform X2 [Mus pahari]
MPEEERQAGPVLPMRLEKDSSKRSRWGFLVTGVVGGALLTVYAVATPFITPALRKVCLPFVPATSKQVENVVKMLQHRRGPLVDIGSGDGRIVIAAAKEGFPAVGYELNPWLVWYSRYRAWRAGVHGSAKFYISDLWKVTFAQYSNVVIFGVPQMMPQLEKKLEFELEDGARVIACRFPFPHWTPDHTTGEGIDTVWAYDMSACRGRGKMARSGAGRPEEPLGDSLAAGLRIRDTEQAPWRRVTSHCCSPSHLEKRNRTQRTI